MKDSFGRAIEYLRVSVTDRCNLRCRYCMPQEGVTFVPHEKILSYEEIAEVVRVAVRRGVWKVRLTGGEPLVRRDVSRLVAMLAPFPGLRDLAMTTNGLLLAKFARELAEAGLKRVNVSLDTLDPARFRELTRGGDVRKVLEGIEAARVAGLVPIKLNCVVAEHPSEEDARAVEQWGRERGYEVRFIRRMNLEEGDFSVVEGGTGGDCVCCNRLRLSADGLLRPCLFSDLRVSVRELGPERALEEAVRCKPEAGTLNRTSPMHSIGG
jgi:cyclic pyranopterin phosphate synthase